jgi:D-3-phosphoglycerate dehydrogenase/C-terminal binding protein
MIRRAGGGDAASRRFEPGGEDVRILLVDKTFADAPDIEHEVVGRVGEFTCYDSTEAVPTEAWRAADGVQTFRASPTVNAMAMAGRLDNCRIIVRGGVGFDNLDLAKLGAMGIAVCNVPDYGTTEVADHAMALVLALRRGIATFHDAMRADPLAGWRFEGAPCLARLRGRRFGIVGLGRIGTATARRAQGFDMEVVFYDPYLPDGVELATGYTRVASLAALVEAADAISLHTPLTEETRGMINAEALARAKPGAVLINTARGPVVDFDALYAALKDGRLGGAALDVLPTEPPDSTHPLIKAHAAREPWLDGRFILTPHAAFYSADGIRDLRRKCVETAVGYLTEGRLRNCVNREWLKDAPG